MTTDHHNPATGAPAAPLEPLQEAILANLLPSIEGPYAVQVRRLVGDIALIAYELGWNVAHALRAEESR